MDHQAGPWSAEYGGGGLQHDGGSQQYQDQNLQYGSQLYQDQNLQYGSQQNQDQSLQYGGGEVHELPETVLRPEKEVSAIPVQYPVEGMEPYSGVSTMFQKNGSPMSGSAFPTSTDGQHSNIQLNYPHNGAGEGQQRGRRKELLLFGIIAVAIAVVAGVIGGIVGWKVTEAKNDSSNSHNINPATAGPTNSSSGSGSGSCSSGIISTAGASKTILANSTLAASGYRMTGPGPSTDFALQLYYVGPDNVMRYSLWDTIYQNWSMPYNTEIGVTASTTIGSTVLFFSNGAGFPQTPQIEMFYTNNEYIRGQNWHSGDTGVGIADSIVNKSFNVGTTSRIAAFWPSIIVQSSAGAIQESFYSTNGTGYIAPENLGSAVGTPWAQLVALPLTSSHEGQDLRVIFSQDGNTTSTGAGNLAVFDRQADGSPVPGTPQTLPYAVPASAPLAGFATARTDQATNTYLLWQAANGTIFFGYQDDDTDVWHGPLADPVFAGADHPTQLACVTAASTGFAGTVPLVTGANDMNMCFFQSGGAVKQVWYDGTAWHDMGWVQMP